MFLRNLLLKTFPTPRQIFAIAQVLRVSRLLSWAFSSYALWHEANKEAVIAWHKEELLKIDWEYELQDAQRQLVAARERARERGVRPLDPEYPDLQDFLKR